jgi:AcrR family transcriptional regulator
MDSDRVAKKSTAAKGATRSPPSDRRVQSMRRRTEERLLEGAVRAVASRGLAKLGMSDVGEFAGVSRGTVYRYFPNTDVLLDELGRREAANFERQVWEALEKAPSDEERLRVTLDYLAKLARDHPLVQRLPETDPGFVLTALRARFPEIRKTFERLLVTVLEDSSLVRQGVVTPEQLAGWTARMMISLFLFPDANPAETAKSMASAFQILAQSPTEAEPAPGSGRRPAKSKQAPNPQPRQKRRG